MKHEEGGFFKGNWTQEIDVVLKIMSLIHSIASERDAIICVLNIHADFKEENMIGCIRMGSLPSFFLGVWGLKLLVYEEVDLKPRVLSLQ